MDLVEVDFVRFDVAVEEILKTFEVVLVVFEGFLGTVFGDLAVFEKFANVLGELHLGTLRGYLYSSTGGLKFQAEVVGSTFP